MIDFNHEYWATMNEPEAGNLLELDRFFHRIFADEIHRYRNTSAEPILVRCRDALKRVAWAGVNVPFPHDTYAHFMAVTDNVLTAYVDDFYADLRTEMVIIDHHAHVIQRTWKSVNTDPGHPACRRRLMREFNDLS